MHEAKWRGWSGVTIAVVALSGWGCGEPKPGGDSVAARPDTAPTTVVRVAPSNATIVAEAESLYTYGRERPQLTVKDPEFPGRYVGDDSLPRMWIATATLKEGVRRPSRRIIARIRSERPYPLAGIASGYNYVWRSSWNADSAASWVTTIVSRDARAKPYVLTRDPRKREYTHGMSAREPRLVRVKVHSVAFGACLDDPICPTGHCGYY